MDTLIQADMPGSSGRLMPRQPAPILQVPTLRGPVWTLADQRPERFTLLVAYRG